MRFFSSLTAVLAVALSVNAASIHKRAPANVESCVSSLKYVPTEIDKLQTTVQDGKLLDINTNYRDLQHSIENAQASCCAINTAIADGDADYVTNEIGIITPKIQDTLTLVSQKRADYHFVTRLLVKHRIEQLDKITTNLDTCLINFTPEAKRAALQTYIDAINLAFSSTLAAYA